MPSDSSSGSGGDEFVCELSLGDALPDCQECLDEKCSDLYAYCEEDEACVCMLECLSTVGLGGVDDCLDQLGLAGRPFGFPQLEECAAYNCPDSDECATPDGWTPPDADLECDGLGNGSLGDGTESDCAFDPTLDADPQGEVLQLQTEDGSFCARIQRTSLGGGTLENTEWRLDDVRMGPLGEVSHIDDPDSLCWYSSHHNFDDWAHVTTGGRHYDLALKEDGLGGTEEGHDGARRYHLYVFEEGEFDPEECAPTADGTNCIEGPILLYLVEPG
jgi:hypothetical protein